MTLEILTSDPLALLAISAGQVQAPEAEVGSPVGRSLDSPQEAHRIGDPVPIVFARRVGSAGGIMTSPKATEARFENDANNAVTASYHLILSEGQVDLLQVRDVFQRACRVGTFSQTYNRRAGTWDPGNFIVQRAGYSLPICPYYCGTIGAYTGMSTLSFVSGAIPDGFDQWNRQVHAFIRGGMWVTRLEDDVLGPSNSFADLVLWLMKRSARVPDAVIDLPAMEAADTFLRANGLTCNCEIRDSSNLPELIARWAPYFLLTGSRSGGKRGLRPLIPTLANGSIDTGAIVPAWAFGEGTIIPGTVEIDYIDRAERLPFVAQVIWRQQLESDYGIIRTVEVRLAGTAADGPYESHDLSEFCTSELHAARVGAYLVAKRVYTSHTIRFSARPGGHSTLQRGQIIRVRFNRLAEGSIPAVHDFLYRLERVTKTLAGDLSYEATHLPIDSQGRSLIALAVANAQGTGITMSSNRTGITCDVNSSGDTTIPTETWTDVDFGTVDNPFGEIVTFDPDYGVIDPGLLFNGGDGGLSGGVPGEFGDVSGGLSGGVSGNIGGGTSGIPGDSMPPMDYEGGAGIGSGSGGGTVGPGGSIPPITPPDDGCTYTYKAVRVCGSSPPNPFYTQVGGYNGYIVDPSDLGCQIRIYTIKDCGDEPVVSEDVWDVKQCSGTYSDATGDVVVSGQKATGGGLTRVTTTVDATWVDVVVFTGGGVACGSTYGSPSTFVMTTTKEIAGVRRNVTPLGFERCGSIGTAAIYLVYADGTSTELAVVGPFGGADVQDVVTNASFEVTFECLSGTCASMDGYCFDPSDYIP